MTREGKARYRIVYPKYKKGDHTVRKISVDSTYGKNQYNHSTSECSYFIILGCIIILTFSFSQTTYGL